MGRTARDILHDHLSEIKSLPCTCVSQTVTRSLLREGPAAEDSPQNSQLSPHDSLKTLSGSRQRQQAASPPRPPMKAGPGTLAEVLVVGTDAFQEARAALNHLSGQGVASQVRTRRQEPHTDAVPSRPANCPSRAWFLWLSLRNIETRAAVSHIVSHVRSQHAPHHTVSCSHCAQKPALGGALLIRTCVLFRMGRHSRVSLKLWRPWRRGRNCASGARQALPVQQLMPLVALDRTLILALSSPYLHPDPHQTLKTQRSYYHVAG